MKYDFLSISNRKGSSAKWKSMLAYNKNLPDNIIPFSTADMEFKCLPEVVDAIKEYVENTILGYSYMNDDFIGSFVGWMKRRHNYVVSPSSIVSTMGVVVSIFTAIRSFTKKGDGVVIMPPVYQPFYFAVNRTERCLLECDLLKKDDIYTIDFDRLERIFKEGDAKALIFCSPHNPVGRVWKREELERLSALLIKYDIFVISDEIHHDIIMPMKQHIVLETIDERLKDRIVTATSLSKTFNLAGLSLSTAIIPNTKNMECFKKELEKIPHNIHNGLSYKACEVAYNKGETWLSEAIATISNNLTFANDYISSNLPSLKTYYPDGTYLMWIDFSKLHMEDDKLDVFLKDKAQLFLTPGYVFGKESGKGFGRMNMAAPKTLIEMALRRLKNAIDSL